MIASLHKIARLIVIPLIALALIASSPSAAFAQRKGVNDDIMKEDTSKSYALPYALVVLGIALGVIIVARPGTRADEAKRRVDDEEEE